MAHRRQHSFNDSDSLLLDESRSSLISSSLGIRKDPNLEFF